MGPLLKIVAQIRRAFDFRGGYPGAPTSLRPPPLGQSYVRVSAAVLSGGPLVALFHPKGPLMETGQVRKIEAPWLPKEAR